MMKLQSKNSVPRPAEYEGVVVFLDDRYQDALIGVTDDNRAVYDLDKMVSLAIETHGWSEEEAVDWIYYNTLPSLRRDEPTCPIVMHLIIQGGDKV